MLATTEIINIESQASAQITLETTDKSQFLVDINVIEKKAGLVKGFLADKKNSGKVFQVPHITSVILERGL
jgi:hypothetical protein